MTDAEQSRILARDTLEQFPCPYLGMLTCSMTCFQECDLQAIYRDYLALRAVVVAVLGDMTPEEAATLYRSVPIMGPFIGGKSIRPHFNTLADVMEGIACQE